MATESKREEKRRDSDDETVLPQWAIDGLKPAVHGLSSVLWDISYHGKENIPSKGGLIIAANHQTYIDPFWIGGAINRPVRYLAWDEAFEWPIVGKLMGLLGAWPLQVERSDRSAIRRTLEWLRGGGAVVIFPEGGRGKPDGSMIRFKPGAVRMAIEADVPILPVTIRGGHRVWPSTAVVPKPAKVSVIFHPPIRVELKEGEDSRACAKRETERLMTIIGSALSRK